MLKCSESKQFDQKKVIKELSGTLETLFIFADKLAYGSESNNKSLIQMVIKQILCPLDKQLRLLEEKLGQGFSSEIEISSNQDPFKPRIGGSKDSCTVCLSKTSCNTENKRS